MVNFKDSDTKILCLGDIAISNINNIKSEWVKPKISITENETIIMMNWELPIGETKTPIPRSGGGPRIVSHPNSVSLLDKWSPGIATLATNHILDAGKEGLTNTIKSLNQNGFSTIGAGMTKEEILKPLFLELNDGNLVIINWVFPETHPEWMVIPGPNCWPGIDEARKLIEKSKSQADWVMVQAHWGDELFGYPSLEERKIAQELAEAGIDIIICHHPHVVRGMETFGSCPVFYSLGNFFFSDFLDNSGDWVTKWAPRNRESLGVLISFKKGSTPTYKLLSFWQQKDRSIVDPFCRAVKRMKNNSQPLQELDFQDYSKWCLSRRRKFFKWEARWHFGLCRLGFSGSIRYILNKIKNKIIFRFKKNH